MPSSPTHKNLDSLIETPESGAYRLDVNGGTQTREYMAKHSVCVANMVGAGTVGTGDQSGYIVRTCDVERLRGEQGLLRIVWEAVSGIPLPPDEVSVSADNLAPRIESHPNFVMLHNRTVVHETPGGDINIPELDAVFNSVQGQDADIRWGWYSILSAEGQKLVDKIRKGNESYYLAALRYSWATHSFTTPTMVRGGRIESPLGPLAGYFVSDIDWLREADDLQYQNGIWRLTRSWLGGPNGHWDSELYT